MKVNSTTKATLAAATALALGASLAACSSDSSSTSTNSASSDSTSVPSFDLSSVEKDDTLAALVPDSIKSKGSLTVGTSADYAPAEFHDEDGKTIVGYEIDFTKAVAKVLGLDAKFTHQQFSSLLPNIGSTFDIGASSFTVTQAREDAALMITTFNVGSAWGVQQGNPKGVNPTTDPCGLTVGVQAGTAQVEDLEAAAAKCEADGKAKLDVKVYDLQSDASSNLVGGNLDAIYADSSVVGYAAKQTGGKIEQAGKIVNALPQGFVVPKDNQALADALQKATQKLMDNGTLKDVLQAWSVDTDTALTTSEINPPAES